MAEFLVPFDFGCVTDHALFIQQSKDESRMAHKVIVFTFLKILPACRVNNCVAGLNLRPAGAEFRIGSGRVDHNTKQATMTNEADDDYYGTASTNQRFVYPFLRAASLGFCSMPNTNSSFFGLISAFFPAASFDLCPMPPTHSSLVRRRDSLERPN